MAVRRIIRTSVVSLSPFVGDCREFYHPNYSIRCHTSSFTLFDKDSRKFNQDFRILAAGIWNSPLSHCVS